MTMDHSAHVELVRWFAVALATPASAAVLAASWRSLARRRSLDRADQERSS
jgi:hypothetical protein